MADSYAESIQRGIDHLQRSRDGGANFVTQALQHINAGTGNLYGCVSNIRIHSQASALASWFADHALAQMKQWAYVTGKLTRMLLQMSPGMWYPAYELLMPLLSDREPLIRWLMHNDRPYDMARAENHRTPDFHGYQALLALRGEWDRLAARCERILADEPSVANPKFATSGSG